MINKLIRVLRTPSSERFLLQLTSGIDGAALELHYLPSGTVSGTLIVFPDAKLSDDRIPELLKEIDEDLLPGASVDHGNLTFVVVRGDVVGSFTAEAGDGQSKKSRVS